MGEAHYRKNVATIVTNEQRHILLGHRRGGEDGAWLLSQGKMDESQSDR